MTDSIQNHSPATFRLLITAGFTGTFGATISSICMVILEIIVALIISILQHGFRSAFQSFLEGFIEGRPLLLILAILLLVLGAMLLSLIPAFIGGTLLAWFLRHESYGNQLPINRYIRMGLLIGAGLGTILAVLVVILSYTIQTTAHGGIGFQLSAAIPSYILRSVEIIAVSSATGAWTGIQLRKRIPLI